MRGFSGEDTPEPSIYDTCIRCGLCLQSCPTYLETSVETSGPRGRISLIRAVGQGQLDLLSDGFVAQMSECLDCRGCEAVCPSGVRYGRLIEPARAQIRRAQREREGVAARAWRYLTLNVLFTHLWTMRALALCLRVARALGLQSLAGAVGLRDLVALAPPVTSAPFVPRDQRYETSRAQGTAFLHAGCVMHVAFAPVHEASIRMLRRAGLNVVVPADQGCCGAIAVHAGEPELGRAMARKNIAAFERSGADVYVVNAAGCGSALKEYPELFSSSDPWHPRAQRFAARVRDVVEVLDAMELPAPNVALDEIVAYQDACHLANAQRVTAAPRRLLAKIPKIRMVEMPESTLCCGGAGIYNLTQRAMARSLQQRKVDAIQGTGASVVATANPGCAMQIAAGLRAAGSSARVRHVVELLDGAYSGERLAN